MPRKAKKSGGDSAAQGGEQEASEEDSAWDAFYTRLFDFYVEHQHTKVQRNDDAKLFRWCNEQKKTRRALTDKQRERLDFMNFFADDDTPSRNAASSPPRFALPALPPVPPTAPILPPPPAVLADTTDPANGEKKNEKSWVERYQQFATFLEKDFEENPRQGVSESDWKQVLLRVGKVDKGLKEWIKYQKDLYTGRAKVKRPEDALSKERVELMERLRFDWNVSGYSNWTESYNKLVKLKAEIGHVDISQADHGRLGGWVHYQRRQRTKGELSQERIDLLDKLDFVWRKKAPMETWMTRFNQLVEYGKIYGHVDVPKKNSNLGGMQLGRFVLEQRKQYALFQKLKEDPDYVENERRERKLKGERTLFKKCNMTNERIEMLEKIGFKWRLRDPRPYRKNVENRESTEAETAGPARARAKKISRVTTVTNTQQQDSDENTEVNEEEASVDVGGDDDGGFYDDGGDNDEDEDSNIQGLSLSRTSLREQRAMLELRKQQIDSQTAALEAEAATARRIADEAEAKLARIREKAKRVESQLREVDQAEQQSMQEQHNTNSQLEHLLEAANSRKRSAALPAVAAAHPNPLFQQPQQQPQQELQQNQLLQQQQQMPVQQQQQQQLFQQQQWLIGNWKRPRYSFMS